MAGLQRLGLDDAGIKRLVEQDAKLWLDLGTMFGPEGSGFVRMNLASPKSLVQGSLQSLGTSGEGLGEVTVSGAPRSRENV